MQEKRYSSALAMELRLSCTKPSIYTSARGLTHYLQWVGDRQPDQSSSDAALSNDSKQCGKQHHEAAQELEPNTQPSGDKKEGFWIDMSSLEPARVPFAVHELT